MQWQPYLAVAVIVFFPTVVSADEGDLLWEAGINGGRVSGVEQTYGLEVSRYLSPTTRLRLNHSLLSYDRSQTYTRAQLTETLDQRNTSLAIDWFPSQTGGFHVTGGIVKLGKPAKLNGNLTLNGEKLNNQPYVGNFPVDGEVATREFVPLAGLGYRYAPRKAGGWFIQANASYVFDLDSHIQLRPKNNIIHPGGDLATDLQVEADEESAKLSDSYAIYGITIGYRF